MSHKGTLNDLPEQLCQLNMSKVPNFQNPDARNDEAIALILQDEEYGQKIPLDPKLEKISTKEPEQPAKLISSQVELCNIESVLVYMKPTDIQSSDSDSTLNPPQIISPDIKEEKEESKETKLITECPKHCSYCWFRDGYKNLSEFACHQCQGNICRDHYAKICAIKHPQKVESMETDPLRKLRVHHEIIAMRVRNIQNYLHQTESTESNGRVIYEACKECSSISAVLDVLAKDSFM